MSSVLYRQCKKSIYNNIRTHRNTALNHSIQTIFKIYHNTSLIHNYSDKGNNRLSDSSSTKSNTLPTIENKKIIYKMYNDIDISKNKYKKLIEENVLKYSIDV